MTDFIWHQGTFLSALHRFPSKQHLCSPLLGQIFPSRILRLNQRDLLRASPALQLLLSCDGLLNVVKAFVIHHPVAVIFTGKPFDFTTLVLQSSPVDAVGHPDVKRAGPAADDVGEILVFGLHIVNPSSSSAPLCHPEPSECFAKRSLHGVEGPDARLQRQWHCKAFSPLLCMGRRENALQRLCRSRQCRGPSTPCLSRFARDTFRSG